MGKLKFETKEAWVERDPASPGCDGVSLIDSLEGIDDDDKDAIAAARHEAMDIAGLIRNNVPQKEPIEVIDPPIEIIDPPIDNSTPDLSKGNGLSFQDIVEESSQPDPEFQAEIDRLMAMLEDIW